MTDYEVLLSGVVGSTAYGLAGPDSDVDRLGVFAYPTLDLLGLAARRDTIDSHDPDVAMHEAAKYVRLALACNPTVLELMFLPQYETVNPLGVELINIRSWFLSAKRVRNAYLGYATQQFRRLEQRGGSFDSDIPERRVAKHARHLKRLCHQGFQLYTTGELPIKLENPQDYHAFGEAVAAGDIGLARQMIAEYEALFDVAPSMLPGEPDTAAAEAWLLRVRRHYWEVTE
jgi:uncharacterized protein